MKNDLIKSNLIHIKSSLAKQRIRTAAGHSEVQNERNLYTEGRKEYEKRMQDQGYEVKYSEQNELQLDIDTEEQYEWFLLMFKKLKSYDKFASSIYEETISSGGYPRRHIYVRLYQKDKSRKNAQIPYTLTISSRIALQAVLGSDPMREFLSFIRYVHGDKNPILLCEKREEQIPKENASHN
ncbi:MAG: hypothetical protein WDA09_06375 [Bacteriovoracaceae bacterium]